MAKLVKIKEVLLYVAYTETAAECYKWKKFLTDKGIKFTLMAYTADEHHPELLNALSTWNWAKPGEQENKITISSFPFLTWKECYDDFETAVQIALTFDELKTSAPVLNKDLIG